MIRYPLFLRVDLSTTNVRSIIFNETGEVLGRSFRELKIHRPKPEMAEEDPEEIWKATLETMRDAVRTSKASADDIAMISFSTQMHGISMISRDGSILTRLITWLDRRAATQSEELSRVVNPYEIYSRTGCPPLFIYPLAKILWIKENLPKKFSQCYKMLSAKDYVLYRIFGEPHLDRSTASGTQLLNIHKLEWDEALLEVAGIDQDNLPTLHDESEIIGELPREVSKHTFLKSGTPVILGASDAALSNLGLGAVEKGTAGINIGTSGAIRVISDKPLIDESGEARFFCYYATLSRWLPGGAINNAGIILRWFRDSFCQPEMEEALRRGVDPYEVIIEKASTVEPGAGGLLMVPFFAGERFPVRDPKARGILFGLTLEHSKPHITRAILESIMYTLKWIMDILEGHGITIKEIRVGGGGARSSVWRQIQADVLGKTTLYMKVEEASALGAAMLAAISLGIYKDLESASKNMVEVAGSHEPNLENNRRYLEMFRIYRGLYNASKRFYEELSRMQG
ncbi:MAG: xylulokinase [Candidatus Bathyarchaeia archaeon]